MLQPIVTEYQLGLQAAFRQFDCTHAIRIHHHSTPALLCQQDRFVAGLLRA